MILRLAEASENERHARLRGLLIDGCSTSKGRGVVEFCRWVKLGMGTTVRGRFLGRAVPREVRDKEPNILIGCVGLGVVGTSLAQGQIGKACRFV